MPRLVPRHIVQARFVVQLESQTGRWFPGVFEQDLNLLGPSFRLGRNITNTHASVWYDDAVDEQGIAARIAFAQQYRGWPVYISLNNVIMYVGYLFAVRSEDNARVFGQVQFYFADTPDAATSGFIPGAINNFDTINVVAGETATYQGAQFPTQPYPIVSLPRRVTELEMALQITHHELNDAIRAEGGDQEVLISAQEVIEGVIVSPENFSPAVGGDVALTLADLSVTVYRIDRIVRLDTFHTEVRLERTIT